MLSFCRGECFWIWGKKFPSFPLFKTFALLRLLLKKKKKTGYCVPRHPTSNTPKHTCDAHMSDGNVLGGQLTNSQFQLLPLCYHIIISFKLLCPPVCNRSWLNTASLPDSSQRFLWLFPVQPEEHGDGKGGAVLSHVSKHPSHYV